MLCRARCDACVYLLGVARRSCLNVMCSLTELGDSVFLNNYRINLSLTTFLKCCPDELRCNRRAQDDIHTDRQTDRQIWSTDSTVATVSRRQNCRVVGGAKCDAIQNAFSSLLSIQPQLITQKHTGVEL